VAVRTRVRARTRASSKARRPALYRVVLHNDDFTTQEFVVELLMLIFHRPEAEAARIMLHVHHSGLGVAGVYPYEIAETKVEQSIALARSQEFPLLCTMEPE
jgi:ATP-dependent Clp protease adaptor protein ClpS